MSIAPPSPRLELRQAGQCSACPGAAGGGEHGHAHCPFGVVGLSYRTASLDLRGKASFAGDSARALLASLRAEGIAEAMVLSTCNRTEVYFASTDDRLVMRLLADAAGTELEEIEPHLYLKKSLCAACHIFRVVSGLDSAVLGESEIVSQVKEAWRLAEEFGSCGGGLGMLLQRSLEVGKRVRTETELCRGVTSAATLAIEHAARRLGSLEGKHVVLVGAGQIAERVCKDLRPLKLASLTILNRTVEKAGRLALAYDGRAGSLFELREAVAAADLVITAVNTPLVDDALLAGIEKLPLFVDFGVPANVQATRAEVLNIDAIGASCSDNLGRRASAVPPALDIIDEASPASARS